VAPPRKHGVDLVAHREGDDELDVGVVIGVALTRDLIRDVSPMKL
jgi:hypothetical protein